MRPATRSQTQVRAVALTLAAAAGLAIAQPRSQIHAPSQPETIGDLIGALDAEGLAERDRAMLRLFDDGLMSLEQAETLLLDRSLTAEQRLRLEQVALGIFLRGPRAALGISFGGNHPEGTVIARTVEGFHAAEVLRPNDVVLAADGIRTDIEDALRVAILARSPGEVMQISLLRDGQPMEVSVTLGSFINLSSAMRPPEDSLFSAWSIRQSRRESASNPAALAPIPEPDAIAPVWPERGSAEWIAAFRTDDAPESLVVGGRPRQADDPSPTAFTGGPMAQALIAQAERTAAEREAALGILRAQRVDLLADMGAMERALRVGGLNEVERLAIERRLLAARDRLASLEQLIRRRELGVRLEITRP